MANIVLIDDLSCFDASLFYMITKIVVFIISCIDLHNMFAVVIFSKVKKKCIFIYTFFDI